MKDLTMNRMENEQDKNARYSMSIKKVHITDRVIASIQPKRNYQETGKGNLAREAALEANRRGFPKGNPTTLRSDQHLRMIG